MNDAEELLTTSEAGNLVDARPKKLLLRALAGERTKRPPIWLMRQAGLCGGEDRAGRGFARSRHPSPVPGRCHEAIDASGWAANQHAASVSTSSGAG